MRRSVCCMGLVGLLLGCGGGDTGSGSSGVGANKKVNTATTAELVDICNAHKAQIEDTARSACTADGLGTASKATCEAAQSKCLAMAATVDCATANMKDVAGCPVTVGDFESCLNQLTTYFKGLSCDTFDKTPPTPPACARDLSDQCPTLSPMSM